MRTTNGQNEILHFDRAAILNADGCRCDGEVISRALRQHADEGWNIVSTWTDGYLVNFLLARAERA